MFFKTRSGPVGFKPGIKLSGNQSVSPYLDGVLSSACCDIDATQLASYPGTGQTWSNLLSSPADGTPSTAWDLWLGNSDGVEPSPPYDPVFTGTAGSQSAYFNNAQEGAIFKFKNQSQPTTLLNAHRKVSGGPWWFCMVHYLASWGVDNFLGGVNTTGIRGLTIYMNTSGQLQVWDGSSQVSPAIPAFPRTQYNILIVSCNPTLSSNNIRVWSNSRTSVTGTWVPVGDAVASSNFYLGAAQGAGGNPSGYTNINYRTKSFAFGNELLDNTKAGLIIDNLNARHGATYA